MWGELEYLGDSTPSPLSWFVSSKVAALASPANLTFRGIIGQGLSASATPQKIALTFTPQVVGLIRFRICMALANSRPFYVDHVITFRSMATIQFPFPGLGGDYGSAANRRSVSLCRGSAGIYRTPRRRPLAVAHGIRDRSTKPCSGRSTSRSRKRARPRGRPKYRPLCRLWYGCREDLSRTCTKLASRISTLTARAS